jgi:hypothetical protein
MMTIPLRLPEGIVSNYPDMIYEKQIIDHIVSVGRFNFSAPTTYAQGYAYNTMLELLIAEVSLVSGLCLENILKYLATFLGLLTIIFLFGFYENFMSKSKAVIASFLAGSCSHFIFFCAHTVHYSLALTFFTLVLFSLTKKARIWRFLTILSIFIIVSTHHFSSIVMSCYFIITTIAIPAITFLFKKKLWIAEKTTFGAATLFLVMSISWLLYLAFSFFNKIINLFKNVWLDIFTKNEVVFPWAARERMIVTPFHTIGDVGVLIFLLMGIIGFLLTFTGKKIKKFRTLLPFATSGAFIFISATLVFLKYTSMTDLLTRALDYLYFSFAPFSLFAILKISRAFRSYISRKILSTLLICFICISALYYGYASRSYRYEYASPLDKEDVRFPLYEWKSAGLFARDHIKQAVKIWGDKIAFNYIGGYGNIDVQTLPAELNITLLNWLKTYPFLGDLVVLRKSMIYAPYLNYYVDEKEFHYILECNNLLYTSGEIVTLQLVILSVGS